MKSRFYNPWARSIQEISLKATLREKCPNTGKYGPEETLYLETFHAVLIHTPCLSSFWPKLCSHLLGKTSHRRCFILKAAFKNFAIFTGKCLCWSLFLIKLPAFRPVTLLGRDSNTGVFLF